MSTLELLTTVAVGLEVAAAVVLVYLDWREVIFLRGMRPLLPKEQNLPLFDALARRAAFVTLVGAYLLVLTALGALGFSLATIFPPIRAINGLLFLGLLAGPMTLGRAMRRLHVDTLPAPEEDA